MRRFKKHTILILITILALSGGLLFVGAQTEQPVNPDQARPKAQKLLNDGNWKEALEIYKRLVLEAEDNEGKSLVQDYNNAVQCIRNLGTLNEFDTFAEAAVKQHPEDWRLLQAVAQSYMNTNHYGYIIAGEFQRGNHRGGGKWVQAVERDRVRALQLMKQAHPLAKQDDSKNEAAYFYRNFAQYILGNRGYSEAWRLQVLTDLSELPDFNEGRYGYGTSAGAPATPDGKPVFFKVSESFDAAANDGERWRWCLMMAVEFQPSLEQSTLRQLADFHWQQFGVQTLQQYQHFFGRVSQDDENLDQTAARWQLDDLPNDETIAKLATGVTRFELPDEHNFIKIYKRLADEFRDAGSRERLAQIYENRRQYKEAAQQWRTCIKDHGPGYKNNRQKRLEQIVDNWGKFENTMTQPAGKGATIDFRFRNGDKVHFTARRIDVEALLKDIKKYLKSDPDRLDWQRVNIGNIGYYIFNQDQRKYIKEQVADWDLDLKPRPDHFDKLITVGTPLKKAGAYVLTAKMQDGNTSEIIVWISDTAIVKQQLDGEVMYYVADAVTGTPIEKANIEFIGYRQEYLGNNRNQGRQYRIHFANFARFTDADGLLYMKEKDMDRQYSWLAVTRTDEGRLAYLGFSGVWYGRHHDAQYNQTKVYLVTDRPVYRPTHKVEFKFWLRNAQYDMEDVSNFANRNYTVKIRNPRGDEVFSKQFKTDEFGGLDGSYELPDECPLGAYYIWVDGQGGGNFRVEEYKKPEFEVTVDAPTKPVMLGEKIEAKIKAKYFFGEPVLNAKVKYKIQRYSHSANWYPVMPWDWFYGSGYWWFAYDYTWYPGWRTWGCERPTPFWRHTRQTPPELIAEATVPIGPDGTVDVAIDTAVAKAMYGDTDHRYEITAEVTDESRRTIVGSGQVLVAQAPFKVYAWVNRGYYSIGDEIQASFQARTLDGSPVQGQGDLKLLRIEYGKDGKPVENEVQKWDLNTNDRGSASQKMQASKSGQYRLSYTVDDGNGHTIEGGYVFIIRGEGFDGRDFRFNQMEVVPDQAEYKPGDSIELALRTDRVGSTVLFFERPSNGVYLRPKVLRLKGKETVQDVLVSKKDMPNFFVEAFTVADGGVHRATREIVVPPEKRVLNVEVKPDKDTYLPGEEASFEFNVTDIDGKPYAGSLVMSVYDRAVEYISGGSNIGDIKEFFWKWRRHHNPRGEDNLKRWFSNHAIGNGMTFLGVFGHLVAFDSDDDSNAIDELEEAKDKSDFSGGMSNRRGMSWGSNRMLPKSAVAPQMAMEADGMVMADAVAGEEALARQRKAESGAGGGSQEVQPTVRTNFADTAYWNPTITTDENGKAKLSFKMPENLTGWKIRTWAMGHGTRVGEATTEVVTKKNLMLRLQVPRFFVQKDEVVLSANVHNYLDQAVDIRVLLDLPGGVLENIGEPMERRIKLDAQSEQRVDWRVKVLKEGQAVVRMSALTDVESDAMEMKFPAYVHGMLKMDSYSRAIRPDQDSAVIIMRVPAERRIDESRLEVRYSPTLAGAMIDALPYMVEYPWGCTEQTLNRFLPTVITQKVLLDMNLNLNDVRDSLTNLNAQEIGDDKERKGQWERGGYRRYDKDGNYTYVMNPVYSEEVVKEMVQDGVAKLTSMQLSNGGWGWFSGRNEWASVHLTAYVVHGLQQARANGVALVPGTLEKGVKWLENYQKKEVAEIKNKDHGKDHADNLDAFIYMVLLDADVTNAEMRDFIYRDRKRLAVYAKAAAALAYHKQGQVEKRDMLIQNIEQYLVQDDENQTAYLKLPNDGYWWYWYGSEYEAQAYYLKLLAAVKPNDPTASRLVKYLLNNRKNATYWNSTRDTAVVIEAFADYLRATDEMAPDMDVTVMLNGKEMKTVHIDNKNLFTFDNKFVLFGDAVETGEQKLEIKKKGQGPLYINAYLTNFTLEDPITKAGLEVKVERKIYKLVPVEKKVDAAGGHGQALKVRVEKYKRVPITDLEALTSGDLVEVELIVESKNDYEYIIIEDMKPAGFEPVEVRSGYNGNELRAYVEFRDERTAFFCRTLARGKHSVSYRLRAEIPGHFSALPAKISAMYAPELKGNSDEDKVTIEDAKE